MQFKFETPLDFFIIFIILIKFAFILSAIGHIILSHSSSDAAQKEDPTLLYWKERFEFMFFASMSILLIYHFKPGKNKPISEETSMLFFLFGWFLLITAKWSIFIKDSSWYKSISDYVN